jgi:hypothetical protein
MSTNDETTDQNLQSISPINLIFDRVDNIITTTNCFDNKNVSAVPTRKNTSSNLKDVRPFSALLHPNTTQRKTNKFEKTLLQQQQRLKAPCKINDDSWHDPHVGTTGIRNAVTASKLNNKSEIKECTPIHPSQSPRKDVVLTPDKKADMTRQTSNRDDMANIINSIDETLCSSAARTSTRKHIKEDFVETRCNVDAVVESTEDVPKTRAVDRSVMDKPNPCASQQNQHYRVNLQRSLKEDGRYRAEPQLSVTCSRVENPVIPAKWSGLKRNPSPHLMPLSPQSLVSRDATTQKSISMYNKHEHNSYIIGNVDAAVGSFAKRSTEGRSATNEKDRNALQRSQSFQDPRRCSREDNEKLKRKFQHRLSCSHVGMSDLIVDWPGRKRSLLPPSTLLQNENNDTNSNCSIMKQEQNNYRSHCSSEGTQSMNPNIDRSHSYLQKCSFQNQHTTSNLESQSKVSMSLGWSDWEEPTRQDVNALQHGHSERRFESCSGYFDDKGFDDNVYDDDLLVDFASGDNANRPPEVKVNRPFLSNKETPVATLTAQRMQCPPSSIKLKRGETQNTMSTTTMDTDFTDDSCLGNSSCWFHRQHKDAYRQLLAMWEQRGFPSGERPTTTNKYMLDDTTLSEKKNVFSSFKRRLSFVGEKILSALPENRSRRSSLIAETIIHQATRVTAACAEEIDPETSQGTSICSDSNIDGKKSLLMTRVPSNVEIKVKSEGSNIFSSLSNDNVKERHHESQPSTTTNTCEIGSLENIYSKPLLKNDSLPYDASSLGNSASTCRRESLDRIQSVPLLKHDLSPGNSDPSNITREDGNNYRNNLDSSHSHSQCSTSASSRTSSSKLTAQEYAKEKELLNRMIKAQMNILSHVNALPSTKPSFSSMKIQECPVTLRSNNDVWDDYRHELLLTGIGHQLPVGIIVDKFIAQYGKRPTPPVTNPSFHPLDDEDDIARLTNENEEGQQKQRRRSLHQGFDKSSLRKNGRQCSDHVAPGLGDIEENQLDEHLLDKGYRVAVQLIDRFSDRQRQRAWGSLPDDNLLKSDVLFDEEDTAESGNNNVRNVGKINSAPRIIRRLSLPLAMSETTDSEGVSCAHDNTRESDVWFMSSQHEKR